MDCINPFLLEQVILNQEFDKITAFDRLVFSSEYILSNHIIKLEQKLFVFKLVRFSFLENIDSGILVI